MVPLHQQIPLVQELPQFRPRRGIPGYQEHPNKKSKGNINYLFFIPVELEVYKIGLVKISYFVLQKLQIQFKLLISPKDNSTPRLCIFGAKSAPFTRCRL